MAFVRIVAANAPSAFGSAKVSAAQPFVDLVLHRGVQRDVVICAVGALEQVFVQIPQSQNKCV